MKATISKEEYDGYMRYVKSLLFGDYHLAGDILHDILLKAREENYSPRYIYFYLRMEVMKRRKKRRWEVMTNELPNYTAPPQVEEDMKFEDLLSALRHVTLYKRIGNVKKIDVTRTQTAHRVLLMTYKGYSLDEICKELGMKKQAVSDLKTKAKKRLKENIG